MIIVGVVVLIAFIGFVHSDIEKIQKFPILYVYTVTARSCARGLPDYIKTSLEQALLSQPDCDVIMASNYAECATIEIVINSIPNVIKLDITKIASERSVLFAKVCSRMFEANTNGDLWVTSAQRFFSMEDFMVQSGRTEMLHVEADNLLYGKVSELSCLFFLNDMIKLLLAYLIHIMVQDIFFLSITDDAVLIFHASISNVIYQTILLIFDFSVCCNIFSSYVSFSVLFSVHSLSYLIFPLFLSFLLLIIVVYRFITSI